MPVLMDDPTLLTRADVDAPGGNPPRDVLMQLYVKTMSHGPGVDTFSSDEEQEPPVVRRSRSSGRLAPKLEVSFLTDEALRDQLRGLGVQAGPIVASTRKLYERKLQLLRERTLEKNQDLFSDQEDEVTTVPDPVPDPVLDPALELELEQKETVRSYRSNSSQKRGTGVPEDLEFSSSGKRSEKQSRSGARGVSSSSRASAPLVYAAVTTSNQTRSTEAPNSALGSTRAPNSALGSAESQTFSTKSIQSLGSSTRSAPAPGSARKSTQTQDLSGRVTQAPGSATKSTQSQDRSGRVTQAPGSATKSTQSQDRSTKDTEVQVSSFRLNKAEDRSTKDTEVQVSSFRLNKAEDRSTKDTEVQVSSFRLNKAEDRSVRSTQAQDFLTKAPRCHGSSVRSIQSVGSSTGATQDPDSSISPAPDPVVPLFCPILSQVAAAPSRRGPGSSLALGSSSRQTSRDPLSFISSCNISPIKRPTEEESTPATEQEEQEQSQSEPPPEEDPSLSELRLTAICRRPIRGAAGRPVVPSEHSQSTFSTASSVLRSSSAHSSSLKPSSAPSVPTGRRDTAWWKKLLLCLVLAAFLFFVYQAMESNSHAPIE